MLASVSSIIATVTSAIAVAKAAIEAGKDAAPFVKAIYDTFTGKDEITQAELDALERQIDELSAELQVPLPDGD